MNKKQANIANPDRTDYSKGSAKNLSSEAPPVDSQERNNKSNQTLHEILDVLQSAQTSSNPDLLSASQEGTSVKREVKPTYEERKYTGEPNLKMALDREFPNMVESQYVVSSSVHNHDKTTKMSQTKDIAEAKKVIEMFDKTQLKFKKDGTLDRRYNISKKFLDLLRLAGESEESYLSNSNLRSLSSSSSLKMNSGTTNQQYMVSGVQDSFPRIKKPIEEFDKSQLKFKKDETLDKRYKVNELFSNPALADECNETNLNKANLSSNSSLKTSSDPISLQKDVNVLADEAKIQLQRFNKADLVYTLKGKLDRRYKRNKEYIHLMELNGYEVKDL